MIRANQILILFLLALGTACISTVKFNKASSFSYSENLSAYLPPDPVGSTSEITRRNTPIEIDTTLIITARLDSALKIVNDHNSNKTAYVEGLTIQLYSGQDRTTAKEVQLRAFRHFPDSKPKIIFDQPNYKVRMEYFYTQLEAYPVYKSVQAKFGKAILVPTRIPVSNK